MLGRLAAWLADWRDGWLSSDADAIPIPGCQRQSCGRRVHSWSASREILCLPPAHPETKPNRFFSLPLYSPHALSRHLSLSLSLYSLSWSSSALFPPPFPSAVNRPPNSPASLFSGEHRLTPSPSLFPPPLPSFIVLMRQMRGVPSFAFWRVGPVLFRANLTNSVRREEGGGFDWTMRISRGLDNCILAIYLRVFLRERW